MPANDYNREGRARKEEGREKRAKRRSKFQLSLNQQANKKRPMMLMLLMMIPLLMSRIALLKMVMKMM